jgi:nickel/cobalt transporter (NicO) family protein
MFAWLIEAQRTIRQSLTVTFDAYAASGDVSQLVWMLPLAAVFGAAHALTPGHSKAVLAGFIAGSGLSTWRALSSAWLLSFTHITSAVLLAVVATSLLTRTIVGAGQAPLLEWISRMTLIAIGLWLALRPFLRREHVHGEGVAFGFFAGLVPCPLTLFVMALAVKQQVVMAGIAFASAMLVGVAFVLSGVVALALLARNSLAKLLQRFPDASRHLRWIDVCAGLLLIVLALGELY